MKHRTVAALILAPIACGICLGIQMLNNLDPARPTNAPWFSFFVPGMLYGALFEVVALVPLFHLLQRIRHPSSVALAGLGCWRRPKTDPLGAVMPV